MTLRKIAFLAAPLALAGCAAPGADYAGPVGSVAERPAATGEFVSADQPGFVQAPLPDDWWKLYDDPALNALVEKALAANADLRAADANLRKADAVVRETRAGRLVSTTTSGGASLDGSGASFPGTASYDVGLSASLPIDLNGKIARAIEASEASREAVAAARDDVRITVAAATAQAYADVCAANYQLKSAQQVTKLLADTLDATQRLENAGRGTAFDTSRARTALLASEATLPAWRAQRQGALFLLAALMGDPPAEYPQDVADCDTLPSLAKPIPVGDGAALIRRRPDIRAAERTLASDNALVGVAMADLYPTVSLGGSVGLSGPFSGVGSGSSFGFSLGPLISWSFPNRPVVKAQIDQAQAQTEADLADFDATVLDALRETETALETYARDRDTAIALGEARDSAALSADQANKLFRFGRSDFLSLLDAQGGLASAQASHAAAQAQLVDDQIALFLALGGGWQES